MKLDIQSWRKFKMGELFDIHPTKAYKMTNAQLYDDGDTPVVVNSGQNNGIGGFTSQLPTEQGGIITFSDTTDATTIFYQSEDFVGYPHVQGCYPKDDHADKWSEYSLLFFVSVFRASALNKGFDYGNKFRRDIASNLVVKLPIISDGKPDWAYMESYMQAIMGRQAGVVESLGKLAKG